MSYYDNPIDGSRQVARIDQSQAYEVDQYGIWEKDGKFYACSASGCSCWDGTWEVSEPFDTAEAAIQSFEPNSSNYYGPSLNGIEELRKQAAEPK